MAKVWFAGSLLVVMAASISCGRVPTSSGADASPPASPIQTSTPSPSPAPTYSASDLSSIMPTEAELVANGGWQTATRLDLSGPYTPTVNTNPAEKPTLYSVGFLAGDRKTIGNPGAAGIYVVRVFAEVFNSRDAAAAALTYYRSGFSALGYSGPASASSLPSTSWAMVAANGFIAPEFADGTAPIVYVFGWTQGNLVVVVRAGGDATATNDGALHWATLTYSNVPKR